jgi:hypothetical protein
MNAVALALVLVSGQSVDFYQDEVPTQPSRLQDVRVGMGGASIVDLEGVGAAFEAGLEFQPWGPVGLRTTVGSSLKVGWGTFFIAPEAVFRLNPMTSRFSPYVAVGANLALINITDQALGIDPIPTYRLDEGAAGSSDGGATPPEDPNAFAPGTPVEVSIGPQASLGLRWQAFNRFALDFGGRYTMLRFNGNTYNEVLLVLTVCAPGA